MSLLGKFDINSDFTQFYLWGLMIVLTLVILMAWVSPKGKEKRRRGGAKVDDRFQSVEGELID